MALFDMLMGAMGRPTEAQIMSGLGQAPGQPGGGPPIAGAPAPPVGPSGGGAPNPAPGAPQAGQGAPQGQGGTPPATMPSGQQAPNAFQSPSDLGQMYLRLAQHAQAEQSFNNGLAGLAAAIYPGRTSPALMSAMRGNVQDPGEIFGNLMKLQMFNQQQGQYQAFQRSAPDIAKQIGGNVTPDEVLAMGPNAASTAIQANMPPEAMRNWLYAKRQWISSHPDDPTGAQFEQQFPMSMAIVGGMPGVSDVTRQMYQDQASWRQAHTDPKSGQLTQPMPDYLTNISKYQAQKAADVEEQKGFTDVRKNFGDIQDNYDDIIKRIDNIYNNPNLPNVLQTVFPTTGHFAAQFRSKDNIQLANDIDQLGGQVYGESFQKAGQGGNRRTQTEVASLASGLSQVNRTDLDPNAYKQVLMDLRKRTMQAKANLYGEAGWAAPSELQPFQAGIYGEGGELYHGASPGAPNRATVPAQPATAPAVASAAGGGRAPTDAEMNEFNQRVKGGADPAKLRANAAANGVNIPQ